MKMLVSITPDAVVPPRHWFGRFDVFNAFLHEHMPAFVLITNAVANLIDKNDLAQAHEPKIFARVHVPAFLPLQSDGTIQLTNGQAKYLYLEIVNKRVGVIAKQLFEFNGTFVKTATGDWGYRTDLELEDERDVNRQLHSYLNTWFKR